MFKFISLALCPGVLQTGLMLTKEGVKILNFKCQFGDPQCQVSGTHWKIKDAPFFYLLLPFFYLFLL